MKCALKLYSIILLAILTLKPSKSICQTPKGEVSIRESKSTYASLKAYELMHILFALTDTSIYAGTENIHKLLIDRDGTYYQDVIANFGKYQSHALVQKLNKSLSKSANIYRHNLHLAYNTEWRKGKFRKDVKYPLMHRLQYCISKNINRKELTKFAQKNQL